MAIRINTNVASLSAQRSLASSSGQVERSLKALASGSRITKASDDAAGLAISEQLKGQIAGIKQASNNTGAALGFLQSAEGGLNEQNNILIRLRELAVQSSSDTVGDNEREYLDKEFSQLVDEFDRIAKTTTYGSKQLLTGSGDQFEFQVGPNGSSDNIVSFSLEGDSTADSIGVSGMSVSDQDEARDNLERLDESLGKIANIRATFGAIQSRLQVVSNVLSVHSENMQSARSRIADADIAEETANLVQAQTLQNAATAVMAQSSSYSSGADRLIRILG